jgi:hypothetical protein
VLVAIGTRQSWLSYRRELLEKLVTDTSSGKQKVMLSKTIDIAYGYNHVRFTIPTGLIPNLKLSLSSFFAHFFGDYAINYLHENRIGSDKSTYRQFLPQLRKNRPRGNAG